MKTRLANERPLGPGVPGRCTLLGICAAAALALPSRAAPQPAQPNLLENPGFEQGAPGKFPSGWLPHGGKPPQLDRHWVEEARSGKRAVLIIDQVGGARRSEREASSGIRQTVKATPGEWYAASCWAKCLERSQPRGAAWLQLRFHPSHQRHNVHLNAAAPGGLWRRFALAGRAPEGATHAEVYIKTLHTATCRYVVDDFSLQAIGTGPDDQRLPLLLVGSAGIEEAREINLHTPLVADGRPVAHVCAPADQEWRAVAQELVAAVEALSGARLPVRPPDRQALKSAQTTVALGNLNNNFVVERMWLNRYQTVDALRPGPGEYILQTIPEPHDCPRRKNVLLIGASDAAGARRGVQALLQRLKPGAALSVDEWLLEISNARRMPEAAREKLLAGNLSKYWLKDFWQAARRYRDSGDPAYAERARRVLLACAQRYRDYANDPNLLKYWPAPTSAHQFRVYWPEETTSEWIGCMWDFIEECPVFSDQDRRTCSNALLSTLYDLTRHASYWATLASPDTTAAVAFNHTTFPLLGAYFLARHFRRFHGDLDGRVDDILARCRNCFGAQMASWKPSEDAAGYLSIVPAHTIAYSLAEDDYSYFESGAVKTLCHYTAAFCDNTGDAASFGDNGYNRNRYTRNLEWAVWGYRDANVLWWLQQVNRGKWRNPYHPGLAPEPWRDLTGLRVFPLTAALYEYTVKRGSYGHDPTRINVPPAKCFDKISFRENLSKGGQFFLLDGFARGTHLHYDGNAIIKFYADGEDWLIDGDYLVRNTTDHSMLTLSKDGRCAEYEPPCAALEHVADLPGAALTQTAVYDYIDADWTRNLFWLKGRFLCVIDRVEAREPGHFKCECVWKMLDRGATGGDGKRVFSLTREDDTGVGPRDLKLVKQPAPGVEAALRFESRRSRLDFPLALAPGLYSVNTVGFGLNNGTDSFWLTIDGGEPTACHLPLNKFGRAYDSGVNPKKGSMPKVRIKAGGVHLVTVTLRERPGAMLDRVEFIAADGKLAAAVEAEKAPPVPEGLVKPKPPKSFHLKGDGVSRLCFSTRLNHSRLPIRYAHQKFGGRLDPGQAASNQALLYTTAENRSGEFDLRRVSPEAALLLQDGAPLGVFAFGPAVRELPEQLATDAAMVFAGRERLLLCDATRLGAILTADAPVDLEIGLADGAVTVESGERTELTIEGERRTVRDGKRRRLSKAACRDLRDAWRARMEDLARAPAPPPFAGSATTPTPRLERAWTIEPALADGQAQETLEMTAADLDGDDADEILAIRGRFLTCIAADGRVRWEFDGADELYAACAWDTDGDGRAEVFCGGKSKRLYVLDAEGALVREHPIQTYYRVSRTTIHEPRLDDVLVRDFDKDGDWEALLGTVDGFTQLIDHNFEQQWIDGETNHGTTEFQALDVDGDGVDEVAVGNRYGKLRVYRIGDGKLVASVHSELGDVQLAAADLDGDGKPEFLNGSSTGAFKCGTGKGRAGTLWEFPNYGYAVRDIKVADFAPGAGLEVAVASDTEFVYLLAPGGETIRQKDLASAPLALAVLPDRGKTLLAAGCRDGAVWVLDAELSVRGLCRVGAQVNTVTVVRTGAGRLLAVGAADGRVTGLALPGRP